jgi:hypothetical protein
MSSAVIEIRRHFDSTAWQVASVSTASGSTLLLTWTVEPEPVDAGIPAAIRPVLAEALCGLGPCWFAGDEGSGAPVAMLPLRRKLLRRQAPIFRVERASDLWPAFESGTFDWSMAAQWIVVGAKAGGDSDRILEVLRSLLEEWKLPVAWPEGVSAIIQAGVDGDAAGCHCPTRDLERELLESLERRAMANGVGIRTVD